MKWGGDHRPLGGCQVLYVHRLAGVFVLAAIAPAAAAEPPGAGNRVDIRIDALGNSGSYQERVQAALLLGKLHDARAVPALVRALGDDHQTVRGVAAQALGVLGDPAARVPLERAAKDQSPFVQRQVATALLLLSPGAKEGQKHAADRTSRTFVEVGPVSDKSGRASTPVRELVRTKLLDEIRGRPELTADPGAAKPIGYLLDVNIAAWGTKVTRDYMETFCDLTVVVIGLPSRRFLTTLAGEARVRTLRSQYRDRHAPELEAEAANAAAQSATDSVVRLVKTSAPKR